MAYSKDHNITADDSFSIDSFGRWRTSGLGERFNCEFIYDKQPNLFTEVLSGSGTATFNTDSRDITLAVGDSVDGSSSILQQNWYNPYTPGISQLIDITGTLNSANLSGGTTEIFLKNGIDSSERTWTQSGWTETVDDVNWSKSQIFQIDFQSLKIGRIRFFLVRDGIPVNLMNIVNDNIRRTGYWQYPSLPLRWRAYNTATESITEIDYYDNDNGVGFRHRVSINSATTIDAICATVKSEGGSSLYKIPGFPHAVSDGLVAKTVSTTEIPIISIRPKSTFNSLTNNSLVIPEEYNLQSDNPIRYKIIVGANLTNAVWNDVDTINSCVEYDKGATDFSGGEIVDVDYVSTEKNSILKSEGILGRSLLSLLPDDTQKTLTLVAVRTSTSDADVFASLKWKEIR